MVLLIPSQTSLTRALLIGAAATEAPAAECAVLIDRQTARHATSDYDLLTMAELLCHTSAKGETYFYAMEHQGCEYAIQRLEH